MNRKGQPDLLLSAGLIAVYDAEAVVSVEVEKAAARAVHAERSAWHRISRTEPPPLNYCSECMLLAMAAFDALFPKRQTRGEAA